mgnify:CR=1 FL=1
MRRLLLSSSSLLLSAGLVVTGCASSSSNTKDDAAKAADAAPADTAQAPAEPAQKEEAPKPAFAYSADEQTLIDAMAAWSMGKPTDAVKAAALKVYGEEKEPMDLMEGPLADLYAKEGLALDDEGKKKWAAGIMGDVTRKPTLVAAIRMKAIAKVAPLNANGEPEEAWLFGAVRKYEPEAWTVFATKMCGFMQGIAKSGLSTLAKAQAAHLVDKGTYADSVDALQAHLPQPLPKKELYTFTVTSASKDAFVIEAKGTQDEVKGDLWQVSQSEELVNTHPFCDANVMLDKAE